METIRIYKMEKQEFMKYFGSYSYKDYDYDKIEEIIIVEDGRGYHPFSVYVREKGSKAFIAFAIREFSMEEILETYEED